MLARIDWPTALYLLVWAVGAVLLAYWSTPTEW